MFDDTTYEPSRLMYWTSTSYDGEFIFEKISDRFLDADEVLTKYNNWRNSEELTISSRQNRTIITNIKRQADPLEKKGIVGAFCRTYNICEPIDIFLSDIYERTEIDSRYAYIPGSSQGVLVIYDDKFAYSHHGTDPAHCKLMNTFDLIRTHKFSHLDYDENGQSMSPEKENTNHGI